MKNPEHVAQLIAELKAECTSQRELAAVCRCENEMKYPPVIKNNVSNSTIAVEIIDDTHQEFLGLVYSKNANGYYRSHHQFLHRVVWQFFNGKIPKGYQVHHIDNDPDNNNIGNLELLTSAEHRRLHSFLTPARKFTCVICGKEFESHCTREVKYCSAKCQARIEETRICAVCGKEFHPPKSNKQAQTCSRSCAGKFRDKPPKTFIVCAVCGKTFEAHSKRARFCSDDCKRKHEKELDRETRICVICQKEFTCRRTHTTKTCSNACSQKLRLMNYPPKKDCVETRICAVCGKEFTVSVLSKKVTCSGTCARKLSWKTQRLNQTTSGNNLRQIQGGIPIPARAPDTL